MGIRPGRIGSGLQQTGFKIQCPDLQIPAAALLQVLVIHDQQRDRLALCIGRLQHGVADVVPPDGKHDLRVWRDQRLPDRLTKDAEFSGFVDGIHKRMGAKQRGGLRMSIQHPLRPGQRFGGRIPPDRQHQ